MRNRVVPMLMLLFACTTSLAAEPKHDSVNRTIADRVIAPIYENYRQAMHNLPPAIFRLCNSPGDETLAVAKGAFLRSMETWQRLHPVAFGPIETEGLGVRIHFWPDKHGTAGKQLSRLLAKPDPAALENGVAGKSIALQSLAALERLLFSQADLTMTKDSDFACTLAEAIADYQADLAEKIVKSWQKANGHYALFTNANGGNEAYYDAADATANLFNALTASLEGIATNKLKRPLGKSLRRAKPKRAENWRSGRSLLNIIANLETIEAVYLEPGGLNAFLLENGHISLDATIREGLDQTLETARSVELPLDAAVKNETERAKAEKLLGQVEALSALFTGTFAEIALLPVGFNLLDGD